MNFKNSVPQEYAEKLTRLLGRPTIIGEKVIGWENVPSPYIRIEVRDEYIFHDFPAKHHDFVYSYVKMNIEVSVACRLLKVSGSILIDLLKKEVGARCGGLTANDVTLSFVHDVINNNIQASKKEYARRIINKIVTVDKYNLSRRFDNILKRENEGCIIV